MFLEGAESSQNYDQSHVGPMGRESYHRVPKSKPYTFCRSCNYLTGFSGPFATQALAVLSGSIRSSVNHSLQNTLLLLAAALLATLIAICIIQHRRNNHLE